MLWPLFYSRVNSSGMQEGVQVRTCSRGKQHSSFVLDLLAAHSPALSELLSIPCVPFARHFSAGLFSFLMSLYCSTKTRSDLGVSGFYFLYKVVRLRKCRSAVCGAADLIVKSSETSGEKKQLLFIFLLVG